MALLIPPHGGRLTLALVQGEELEYEKKRASEFTQVRMSSRETSDLIMIGIGAFCPLRGFMGKEDWRLVCDELRTANGIFWPIPIALSVSQHKAGEIREGQGIALIDSDRGEFMGSMVVEEKYSIDKIHECQKVFLTDDVKHPGVAEVMTQGEVNLAGPVKVFSELGYPARFGDFYARPDETRAIFAQ